MFGLGAPELLVVLLIVLLLFGGAKLPELARGLGKAVRGFKEEAEGIKREIENATEPLPTTNTSKNTKPEAADQQASNTK